MSTKFIYDSKTTNRTFLKMYVILKKLGVKNNKFFLKLYDKNLQGINPFDEDNLTEEQKLRIKIEIQRNPYYFLREIVRIPVSGGLKRFEIHRGNLALIFCMLNCINLVAILPRQHFKTITTVCCYIWIYYFATENTAILFFNKEFGDSKNNLKRFKEIYDELPSYLKAPKTKKDIDNLEYIVNGNNKNSIRAMPAATNEVDADKKGRGATTALQY